MHFWQKKDIIYWYVDLDINHTEVLIFEEFLDLEVQIWYFINLLHMVKSMFM